jgi:hypothetical protein
MRPRCWFPETLDVRENNSCSNDGIDLSSCSQLAKAAARIHLRAVRSGIPSCPSYSDVVIFLKATSLHLPLQ